MCGIKSKMAGIRPKSFLFLLVLLFSECSPLLAEEVQPIKPSQDYESLTETCFEIQNNLEETTKNWLEDKNNLNLQIRDLKSQLESYKVSETALGLPIDSLKKQLESYNEVASVVQKISEDNKQSIADFVKDLNEQNKLLKTAKRNLIFATIGTSVVGIILGSIVISSLVP